MWLCNNYSLNSIVSWLVNRKTLYYQNYHLIEKSVITFQNQNYLRIFDKHKWPGVAFFLQSSMCISNERPCLKATGVFDGLLLSFSLFQFFYFLFSASILFSLCFPVSLSLFFVVVFWSLYQDDDKLVLIQQKRIVTARLKGGIFECLFYWCGYCYFLY